MDNETFEIPDLFNAMRELVARSLGTLIPVFAAIFALGAVIDYFFWDSLWGTFVILIGQFLIGYLFARELARDAGMIGETESGAGFGGYFGASFLIGLGTGLGYMLFVLPGIFLQIRWSLAIPVLFSQNETDGAGEAISRSWELTGPVFWKLSAAFLIGMVLTGVGLYASVYWSFDETGAPSLLGIIVGNAAYAANTMYFLLMGFAAFLLLRTNKDELQRIFA